MSHSSFYRFLAEHAIVYFVDEDLWQAEAFQFHPLVNTATLVMARLVELTGHALQVIPVPEKQD